MRVLVTGSSGLVGRPVCAALRAAGHTVDEFDLQGPPGKSDGPPFASRDIRDADAVRSAAGRADGVVHLAAISRCAPAEADPHLADAVNVGGTTNVVRAIRSTSRPTWMVFASSREVYGEVTNVPVDESFPVQPKAVYGKTKADAEREIREIGREDPRPVTILRFTNLYGSPWDFPDRVIPAFVSRSRRGEPLEVRGANQILDFLEVRDAVHAILRSIERFESGPADVETFNIASGEGRSLRELADLIVRLNRSQSLVREVGAAAWTPSKFVADISRARRELGWQPTIGLGQGLSELAMAYETLESAR
jgi:nucleoside-diphosphate-sugar epimerase